MIKLIIVIFILCLSINNAKTDQNSPKLDLLFNELFQEKDNSRQTFIINKIWDEWMHSENPDVKVIMNKMPFYFQSKNYNEAIAALSYVIELDPNFSEAYNKRATFYFIIGEYEKSMKDIETTLILEPRHFGAMDGLCRILIYFGQHKQALDIYNEMKLLMPNDNSLDTKINRLKELIYNNA